MPAIELLHDPFARACVRALGWTLLHFAWQGVAIAALAWAAMTLVRGARLRYAIGCVGLLLMIAAPVATYACLAPRRATVAETIVVMPAARPQAAVASAMPRADSTAIKPLQVRSPSMGERFDAALPLVVGVWASGVAALLAYRVIGLASIARLRRAATPIVDPDWIERLERLARTMRIGRAIALLATTRLDCPAVVGIWRPAILWPVAALSGLSPMQVEALLAHELAHIRRHDFLVNLLQSLLETLLFYHPAVWWLSSRVRQEREHCCDDLAASVVGDRARVADALAAMELHRQSSLVLSSNGGSLVKRIRRLVSSPRPNGGRSIGPRGVLIAISAVTCVAAAIWTARAANPTTTPASAPTTTSQPSVEFQGLSNPDRLMACRDVELARLLVVYEEHERNVDRLIERYGTDRELLARIATQLSAAHTAIRDRSHALWLTNPKPPLLSAADLRAAQPVGEFYIGGHIARPGAYSLSGQPITLAQALTAAGGPDVADVPADRRFVSLTRWIGDPHAGGVEYSLTLDWNEAFVGGRMYRMLPHDQVVVGVVGPADRLPTTTRTGGAVIVGDTLISADQIVFENGKDGGLDRLEASGGVKLTRAPATRWSHPLGVGADQIECQDLVDVTITNLAGKGLDQAEAKRVDWDGRIRLPSLDAIEVAGLSPTEAGQFIAAAYDAAGHPGCSVSVTIAPREGTDQPATQTTPAPPATDYRLHPNDVVQVLIMDLAGAGLETRITKRVTETGKITLPYIQEIVIGGKTEAEAEAAIVKAYNDHAILANAVVSLTTIQRSDGLTITMPPPAAGPATVTPAAQPAPR